MLDARDAEDIRLLEQGDFAGLLAKYEPVIVGRCVAAMKGDDQAFDVAQKVMLRLYVEFERGKRYGELPYRVVVRKVIDWTLREHWSGRDTTAPLPEDWDPRPGAGADEDVVARDFIRDFLATLAETERRVFELSMLGFRPEEIAEQLEMNTNAVYQRLHHARKKLRERLEDG